MRVLIIDIEELGLDFALRCAEADHDVIWVRYAKKPIRHGDGFPGIRIVDDFRPHMKWAKDGLIVLTGNWRFLTELDRYREFGFKIFAPTGASAALEIDRTTGLDAMQQAGIDIPVYKTFPTLQAASAFARKSDKAYVFKTMGDEEDKSLSYVSCDPADMVGWLERRIKAGAKLKGLCMLQEKIDMLAEVGVSGWFGPDGFLPDKWQVCFEHKKLMDGEIGPNTGEQGTVCQYVESDKMARDLLEPMIGTLRRLGHRGDFAVGAGVDRDGKAWPFEFTSRLGWPAFFIQVASHKGDPAQWMRDLLDGEDSLKVSRDVAVGVVCAQPMYPYAKSPPELVEGNPISGLDDVIDNVHLAGVMMAKGPVMADGEVKDMLTYQTSSEYVLVATALGKSITAARKKVYKSIEQISFPNMMFRQDIGCKVAEKLPELHRLGYATEMVA